MFGYAGAKPAAVETVVLSHLRRPEVPHHQLHDALVEEVFKPALPTEMLGGNVTYLINPTGRFAVGGPHGDSGLTRRKLIVDTYGGKARDGGGAFSGKDPSKVDRSAAYMARYVAKNIVASGICRECEVQIAYAIGVAAPVSVYVDTFGNRHRAGAAHRSYPATCSICPRPPSSPPSPWPGPYTSIRAAVDKAETPPATRSSTSARRCAAHHDRPVRRHRQSLRRGLRSVERSPIARQRTLRHRRPLSVHYDQGSFDSSSANSGNPCPTTLRCVIVCQLAILHPLAWTVEDWELIIVDRASSNGTVDIVYDLQRRDLRIPRAAEDADHGPALTRNRGLEQERDNLTAFVDSDDRSFPENTAKPPTVMERDQADLPYIGLQAHTRR